MTRKTPDRRKLTAPAIAGLLPRAQAYLVWDAHQRGLAVVVQPTGHKAYVVVYRANGRPRWYTLGPCDVLGLKAARTQAAKLLLQVATGIDPGAERRAARSAGTFAELAQRYVADYAQRHNKAWAHTASLVNRNLIPRWGNLPAASITRADVKATFNRIASPISANQTLAAASAIFNWAMREEIGGIRVNPCSHVARNETKARERVLRPDELPQFWAACDAAGLVVGTALKVLLLTGQRPGEVAGMRREHISNGWWELPGAPQANGWPGTKNAATHRVWLPRTVQDLLADLGTSGGRVFTCEREALARAMRAFPLNPKATPHDLRRTHGTTVTALGFGREAMNRIQNHKEGGIASVYDRHGYAGETKQIMEAVAARLMAHVTGGATDNIVTAKFGT
jgi:integrase